MNIHVRDAVCDDATAIADIYNHYVVTSVATFEEEPVSSAQMAERIQTRQDEGYDWLVAEQDEQVLGYAYSGRWMARSAYRFTVEVSVYVAETAHGQGVGRKLYDQLFARIRSGGFHTVIGIITLPNPASVKLHESFGLRKVAHYQEVGQKFDRWIDVGQWQGKLTD